MPYDKKVFEQFEKLSPQEQQARIQSLDPNQLDQFENDYQAYQLQSGANRYQRVARGGLAEPTQATKPTGSQILQSTGKELINVAGKEVVKEGIKQGASKLLSSGASQGTSNFFSATAPEAAANSGWANAGSSSGSGAGSSGVGVAGKALSAVAAAKGTYDAFKGMQNGGEGTRAGLTTAGAGIGSMIFGPVGGAVGAVGGNVLGYGMQGDGWKNDLAMYAVLGPVGLAAKKFGILANRKTTKQYAEERYDRAMENHKTDIDKDFTTRFYNAGLEDNAKNPDAIFGEGHELAGRQYNWDEVKKVSDGKDLWGSGAFSTAFPDWISGYTEDQRARIAQAALDHDLITPDKGGLVFSGKHGDEARIQSIAQQVKEGTYQPLRTDEQIWADKQAFLQKLNDEEGYVSPELGKPYVPPSVKEAEQRSAPVENAPAQGSSVYKPKPKPKFNDIPAPVPQPVPKPEIRTPKDYAQAYLDVYNANSQLSGVNPYLRRY